MILSSIQIKSFRNISNLSTPFGSHFNIIYGNNGNGKTNLLEAIYYTSSLKPIKKKTQLTHLIQHEASYSHIKTTFKNLNQLNETIKLILSPEKKALIYNNNPNTNLKNYLHKFKSVLFTPDDLMIIKGEPERRREFFNKAIFHSNPLYYSYILEYNKILRGRNKILKSINEGVKNQDSLLDALDTQFAELSTKIYQERMQYLLDFIPLFIDTINQLSKKDYIPYLVYKTDFNYKQKEEFLNKLKQKRQREIQYKRTLLGPHLDDYKILTNDKELKTFGSQGEIRLFSLAIKIAHIMHIHQKTNAYPILLLDDISSELDQERQEFLFNFLKKLNTQVFITTTTPNNLPKLEQANYFQMVHGKLITP